MQEKHPDHTADFEYPSDWYIVKLGDEVIAKSSNVVLLKESSPTGDHPDIPYFPISDVRQELLTPTDHKTQCPLKGEASHYNLTAEDQTLEYAAWHYPEPLEHVPELEDRVAFYPDHFSITMERDISAEIIAGYEALRNS